MQIRFWKCIEKNITWPRKREVLFELDVVISDTIFVFFFLKRLSYILHNILQLSGL
ncbi:preprotein translocase subunit SecE [Epilithonimonas zeae]|uniref:preprotein translocase subunit SecE n=1 Tax=Epilithonimonas zeae TaxID=1416779 RepID=UPI0009412FC7